MNSFMFWGESEERKENIIIEALLRKKTTHKNLDLIIGRCRGSFEANCIAIDSDFTGHWLEVFQTGNTVDRRWSAAFTPPIEVKKVERKISKCLDLIADLESAHQKFLCSDLGKELKENSNPDLSFEEIQKEFSKIDRPFSHVVAEERRG